MPSTGESVIDLVDLQPMMRVEISRTCPCDGDAIELRHGSCLLRSTVTVPVSDLQLAWCRAGAVAGNVVSSSSFSQRLGPAA